MEFSGVKIHEKVLEALQNDTLVIMAGAGVSMGKPACLPNFKKLAESITGEVPTEPFDQFLGDHFYKDNALKRRVAEVINNDMEATPLHKDLLRIFKDKKKVKIITTNYDKLFEKASSKDDITVFTAPALPLGSEFNGIVHIHGSVDKPNNMVLTDIDVGRAYITKGWARRFLVDVFEHYTVLFVGYSHDDTVLHYLARALPHKAKNNRFSLVSSQEDKDKWRRLDIEIIEFKQEKTDDFKVLDKAVSELADFVEKKNEDWKSEIAAILKKKPKEVKESDKNKIIFCLNDKEKISFVEQADDVNIEWIDWLYDKNELKDIFCKNDLDEKMKKIRCWVVSTCKDDPEYLIRLINQDGREIGSEFWYKLYEVVDVHVKDKKIFRKWFDFMLYTS